MNRALALLALLTPLSAAQSRFSYRDPEGNLNVAANSARGVKVSGASVLFDVVGAVVLGSASQGVTLKADAVTGEAVQGANKKTEIRKATATGNVRLVKAVKDAGSNQTTEMSGTRAELRTGATEALVSMSGPVTIRTIDQIERQTMNATGSSCTATLLPTAKAKRYGIRTATLQGPVRITAFQEAKKGQEQARVVATGRNARIDYTGKQPTIVLTGDARVSYEGAQKLGEMKSDVITLRLNEKGKVVEAQTGALR